jgi:hypothetical protein
MVRFVGGVLPLSHKTGIFAPHRVDWRRPRSTLPASAVRRLASLRFARLPTSAGEELRRHMMCLLPASFARADARLARSLRLARITMRACHAASVLYAAFIFPRRGKGCCSRTDSQQRFELPMSNHETLLPSGRKVAKLLINHLFDSAPRILHYA